METGIEVDDRRAARRSYKSSYEEWKRLVDPDTGAKEVLLQIFLWGMETLSLLSAVSLPPYVTNLPMRNGNHHKSSGTNALQ